MDVKQLSALIAVAETGSVTRAAALLHLVQPAVSRQIRMLEDELGTPLFERTQRGMALTDDGQVLLDYARRALRELERARAEIAPAGRELRGLVTIGLLPSVPDALGAAVVTRVAARHPAVRLRVMVGYSGHIAGWLDSAEVDFAVLYEVKPGASVDTYPLIEEPLWAIGPPGADLRADRPVQLSRLADQPVILPGPPHALRSMVDRASVELDLCLRIVTETNSMTLQRQLVIDGVGYTVLPITAVTEAVATGAVSAAPLTGAALQRQVVLAVPNTRRLGPAVRAVSDIVVRVMFEAVTSGTWPGARIVGKPTL
jgi:LysR family nitrogen assimilation transcriptional regulator